MLARSCAARLPSAASAARRAASLAPKSARATAPRLLALSEGEPAAQRLQALPASLAARGRATENLLESLALEPLSSRTTLTLVGGGLVISGCAGLKSTKCVSDDDDDDAGEEDDALKSQLCITNLYDKKYCIAARIIKYAMWDKRDEHKWWCVDTCDVAYSQNLWCLRTESANLDGTDAMVRSRGLSMAYDHTEHTLNVVADGDWKGDATMVQFPEPAVQFYGLGLVGLPGRDVVSLRGAARDGVVF